MSKNINRHSSGIWNYFQKQDIVMGGDPKLQKIGGRVQCLLCQEKGVVHVYKPKTSSGNLWRHLHRSHGVSLPENSVTANGQQQISTATISATSTPSKSICSWNGETFGDEAFFGEELEERTEIGANGVNVSYKVDIGSLLIAEVAKRPELYECNSKINIKKAKRDALWNDVYEALDKVMDINRLQKMWKNIRDRYKKLRHMDQAKLTDVGSRYKYYDQLKFLDSYVDQQHQQQQQVVVQAGAAIATTTTATYIDVQNVQNVLQQQQQHHHHQQQQHQHHHQQQQQQQLQPPPQQQQQQQQSSQQPQITSTVTRNAIDIKIDPDFQNAVTGTIEFHSDSLAISDGTDGESANKRMKFCNEILTSHTANMQPEQHVTFSNDFSLTSHEITDNQVAQGNEISTIELTSANRKDDCVAGLTQPDEFDLFGRLIAEKLRKMQGPRINEVEIKILQLLQSEERYTVIH